MMRYSLTKFLGINEATTGETNLSFGESPYMRNFRIVDSYKLKKRDGWTTLHNVSAGHPIKGIWKGTIGGIDKLIVACNSKLYLCGSTCTELGSVADSNVCFFKFSDKLYVMDGVKYRVYNGTTLSEVSGYAPVVITAANPASGAGTELENANLLTGQKRMRFSGTGTDTVYKLAESSITSVDAVTVNGTAITAYTTDLTDGEVTFTTAPPAGANNVEIKWTKTSDEQTANRAIIEKMLGAMVSGGNDTRIFAWGNSDKPNFVYWTGLADGVPSAEYWPALSYNAIGSEPITDIVRQYDRNIIFSKSDAWYSAWELVEDGENNYYTSFPVYPLNSNKGCTLFRGAQVILNNPVTVTPDGIYEWVSTAVRDERNASYISERVKNTLLEKGEPVATVDNEKYGEYWLSFSDGTVVVYNYRYNLWYVYDSIPASSFLYSEGDVYFGTSDGCLCKFEAGRLNDDGSAFTARWDMAFFSYGQNAYLKDLHRIYINLKPETRSKVKLKWNTDYYYGDADDYGFALFDYGAIDYTDWSYITNNVERTFRKLVYIKRWNFLKISLLNDEAHSDCSISAVEFDGTPTRETKYTGGTVK